MLSFSKAWNWIFLNLCGNFKTLLWREQSRFLNFLRILLHSCHFFLRISHLKIIYCWIINRCTWISFCHIWIIRWIRVSRCKSHSTTGIVRFEMPGRVRTRQKPAVRGGDSRWVSWDEKCMMHCISLSLFLSLSLPCSAFLVILYISPFFVLFIKSISVYYFILFFSMCFYSCRNLHLYATSWCKFRSVSPIHLWGLSLIIFLLFPCISLHSLYSSTFFLTFLLFFFFLCLIVSRS